MREDNELLGETYVYSYDYAGNITSKKVYAWTEGDVSAMTPIDVYEYGYGDPRWGDLLISYCGRTNAYDAVGNPTRYYNGTQWHFTWSGGRRLAVANNGTVTLSFEYNGDGLRTSKTVNGVKHTYRLNGSRIVSEAWGNHLLIYLYDAEGVPVGMMYRNSTYPSDTFDTFWFEKNLQGDIVAVYDAAGTKLISYTYDAWGNFVTTYHNDCTASDPANFNPYRYRSYYYDAELEMYYLQSRYYDPMVGRFINADVYVSTGQDFLETNMFAYCGNNPINYVDYDGYWAIKCNPVIGEILKRVLAKNFANDTFSKTEGLINGQAVFEFANEKCGLGTYAKNGCGVIAIYNAMQLLKKNQSLGSIETAFQYKYGMILYGLGGIGPWSFGEYFDSKNIKYKGYSSYANLERDLSNGDVIVFTVRNSRKNIFKGYHTMAARFIGGRFVVYNISSIITTPTSVNSLDPVYDDSKWIYGYIVGG